MNVLGLAQLNDEPVLFLQELAVHVCPEARMPAAVQMEEQETLLLKARKKA